MGRPQHQLKARFKEIKDQNGGPVAEEKKVDTTKGEEKVEKKGKNKGKGKKDADGDAEAKVQAGPDDENRKEDKEKIEKATKSDKKNENMKDAKAKPAEKKHGSKKDATDNPAEKKQNNNSDNTDAKHSSKARSMNSGKKSRGEARFTMNEWLQLQEDDMFSFGELQALSDLIMKDQSQTWLRVAAAFFDLTGRRVHPEDIREKFMEMVKMAR